MTTEIDGQFLRPLLPKRPEGGHKGTFGHVFIIAGSRGFTGAVKLACGGATRSGAGLVTAGVPSTLGDVVASFLTESMTYLLPGTEGESISYAALDQALDFSSSKQAVALGPGLSQHEDTKRFVREFVARCPVPLVIDADGLNCLGGSTEVLEKTVSPIVVTPHPGEMARLAGRTTAEVQHDRGPNAQEFASRYGCVVVLKGHETVIASDDEVYVNPTGNVGLATGGTGDVLTGLLGGLLAQGMKGLDASLVAVYLHGLAGDVAARAKTQRGMIARDLVEALPAAWRVLEEGD